MNEHGVARSAGEPLGHAPDRTNPGLLLPSAPDGSEGGIQLHRVTRPYTDLDCKRFSDLGSAASHDVAVDGLAEGPVPFDSATIGSLLQ